MEVLTAIPGNKIEVTADPAEIREADFVIIAVSIMVTRANDPDLEPLESALRIMG